MLFYAVLYGPWRLPPYLPARERVQIASRAGWIGAFLAAYCRNPAKMDKQALWEWMHGNRVRAAIGMRMTVAAAKNLDVATMPPMMFSALVEVLAKEQGLTCADGSVAEGILAVLHDVADALEGLSLSPPQSRHRANGPGTHAGIPVR